MLLGGVGESGGPEGHFHSPGTKRRSNMAVPPERSVQERFARRDAKATCHYDMPFTNHHCTDALLCKSSKGADVNDLVFSKQ